MAYGTPSGNLYRLKLQEIAHGVSLRHTIKCQHTWHSRFGHRHPEALKLLSQGLATGIEIKDCGIRTTCECCIREKLSRKPFPKKLNTETKAPLELLHTDLCGPIQVQTPGGKRYALTVIDDYSRYTHIYLLDKKSSTTEALKRYIKMVSNKFNKKPKLIRSDREREYIDKKLVEEFKKDGISIQFTAPYSYLSRTEWLKEKIETCLKWSDAFRSKLTVPVLGRSTEYSQLPPKLIADESIDQDTIRALGE